MIWLLFLFFITLFVGMSPMDAAAILLSLLAIYDLFKRRSEKGRWLLYSTGLGWIFITWVGVIILGLAVNNSWGDSALRHLIEFKWILFLYLLVYTLIRSRLDEDILVAASIPAIIAGVYACAISFVGIDPIKDRGLETVIGTNFWRTGGFFSDSMSLAHSYSMAACLFLGLFFSYFKFRDKKKYLLGFASLVLLLTVLLTFTRGAWLGLGLAVIVMAFLISRLFAVVLFGLGGILFSFLYSEWPAFQTRIDTSLSSSGYDSERLWIWKANWQIFREHPFLGVGYGENTSLLKFYFEKVGAPAETLVSHAHNQYLHFASGTGVIGLGLYLIVLLYFFVLSLRCWSRLSEKNVFERGLCLGLIGAQISFIIGGLTEANFESSKIRYLLLLCWALTVWLSYEVGVKKTDVGY